MTRGNILAALQKTYDDTHLVCSTAVYFESRSQSTEALRCWRNALEQLAYHNAYRLPSNYRPATQTEQALHTSLKQMELQCKERVDLLDALEKSRLEAVEEGRILDGEDNHEFALGAGTVRPLDAADLVRPPPLPTRPAPAPSTSRSAVPRAASSERVETTRYRPETLSPLAADAPADPSRSPSPDKKFRMKSTLRPRKLREDSSSSVRTSAGPSRRAPAAASASAATQAWTLPSRPLPSSLPSGVVNGSASAAAISSLDVHKRDKARVRDIQIDSQDLSEPEMTRVSTEQPRPGNRLRPAVDPWATHRHSEGEIADSHSKERKRVRAVRRTAQQSETTTPKYSSPSTTATARGKQPLGSVPKAIDTQSSPSLAASRGRPSPRIQRKPLSSPRHPLPDPPIDDDPFHTPNDSDSESPRGSGADEPSLSEQLGAEAEELSFLSLSERVMADLPRGVDPSAAEQIMNEVVIHGDDVHWADIAGLDIAKTALKENVVYPFLRPDLFRGLREPARGILLFGPPGTGKTMLARAVATESNSTFFAISASSLTSKFLGESEKLVRALFALAKKMAPAVIFVDEIDSLLSARSDSGEHETSRRIKTEFLIQWSDLQRAAAGRDSPRIKGATDSTVGDASRVLVLAATNAPWTIDEAARRRFVRRQYIPLPEDGVRLMQVKTLLQNQKHAVSQEDMQKLVDMTDGFSGSDLTALTKDAAMGPLRSLGEKLLFTRTEDIRPILFEDFTTSLQNIRPSVSKQGLKQFEDWATEYGERGG